MNRTNRAGGIAACLFLYLFVVWAALLLLLLEFALLDRRNTLLARFNIFREAAPRS